MCVCVFFFSVLLKCLKQRKIKFKVRIRFIHNRDGYFIERFVPGRIEVQSSPFFFHPVSLEAVSTTMKNWPEQAL